jgi:serine protease AprX
MRPPSTSPGSAAVSAIGLPGAWAAGFRGEGEVISVCDTGFDRGGLGDVHPAFAGRVLAIDVVGASMASDRDGHGTSVAGCAAADGFSEDGGPVAGSAPRASLVVQAAMTIDGLLELPIDLASVFEHARREHDVRVHLLAITDAGSSAPGEYGPTADSIDRFIERRRDAVVILSVGNDGVPRENERGEIEIAAGSVGSPATAKNALAVGACENDWPTFPGTYGETHPFSHALEPFASDRLADSSESLAAFSSRGPTTDGRTKPDLVAPGTCVPTPRSRAAPHAASSQFGELGDPLYRMSGGSSLSAGFVAGAAALVREWLRRERAMGAPSAALVKALLLNGAKPLAGGATCGEGFGRLDVSRAIGLGGRIELDDEGPALVEGESSASSMEVVEGDLLSVTLAWTDPPGPSLMHDLDLVVEVDGARLHGNRAPGDRTFDRTNNVERVRTLVRTSGRAKILVRAIKTERRGQTFALVRSVAPPSSGAR